VFWWMAAEFGAGKAGVSGNKGGRWSVVVGVNCQIQCRYLFSASLYRIVCFV